MTTPVPGSSEWQWSNPQTYFNPDTGQWESDGMIWRGNEPPTDEDFAALKDYYSREGMEPSVDRRTVCGRYAAKWTTYYNEMSGTQPDGGKGSYVYMMQHVGNNVEFTDDPIWYYNADGVQVRGVPPNCGAYCKYQSAYHEGPYPGLGPG